MHIRRSPTCLTGGYLIGRAAPGVPSASSWSRLSHPSSLSLSGVSGVLAYGSLSSHCRLVVDSLSALSRDSSIGAGPSFLGLQLSNSHSPDLCLAFACPADLPLSRCFLCFSGCPLRSPPPGRRYPSPLHLREPRSPRLLFSVRSSSYSTLPLFPLSPPPPPPPRPALTCQP